MCLKSTFASFRGTSWKETPVFPSKSILKHFFPAVRWRPLDFFMPPFASSSCGHCWTSTTSTRSQWGTAGPQPRLPDLSGHCRSLTKFLGRGPSQLVTAFADLSRSFRGFLGYISRKLWIIFMVWVQIHTRKLSKQTQTRILSLESLFRELSRKQIFAKAFANLSRTWF